MVVLMEWEKVVLTEIVKADLMVMMKVCNLEKQSVATKVNCLVNSLVGLLVLM